MEYQIPEIAKSRPIYDFLQAVKDVAPDFTGYWKVRIQSSEQLGERIPDVYQLLEHFRNHIRIENAENAQMTHGAFGASFQGQQLDKKEDEKKEKEYKPCLCGKKHRFKTCWYLIEILRPAEWKPDPEIEKQIKEKLEKSSKLRDIIERIRKQVTSKKEEGKSQKPATFMTSVFNSESSAYMLCKSVILDSGATIHVCNNRERFQSLRPVGKEEFIYAGNTTIPIEGFGNAIITINTPEGQKEIELADAAYVPSFHTTVASLKKFVVKDVHLDTKKNRLTYQEQTYCELGEHYGQWTLEFHEPPSSFPAHMAQQPDSIPDLWYQRLGHIGPEAVKHLPEIEKNGMGTPKTIDCETCSISKTHQIISRQPQARANKPFKKIHFDLIQMTPAYNGD